MNTSTLKHNHQSPSRSKSKSRLSTSPQKNIGSPRLNQKKPKISDQAITSKMKSTRQKLCNTLDAYVLILQTNAPLRCLQHNSVLSLYCETEQKLLCANCVYRSNNHRLHRVFPMEKCYKQIAKDVEQMSRLIERQISWADGVSKSIIDYFKEQQKNTSQALMTIAQMYDQIQFQLSKSFENSKRKILAEMDSVFSKKQSLLLELQFYNHINTKNKPSNLQAIQNTDPSNNQYNLIFNHLIGFALLELGKFDGSKIHDGASKIKMIEKQQMAKLKQIKMRVQSWKSQQKQQQKNIGNPIN